MIALLVFWRSAKSKKGLFGKIKNFSTNGLFWKVQSVIAQGSFLKAQRATARRVFLKSARTIQIIVLPLFEKRRKTSCPALHIWKVIFFSFPAKVAARRQVAWLYSELLLSFCKKKIFQFNDIQLSQQMCIHFRKEKTFSTLNKYNKLACFQTEK